MNWKAWGAVAAVFAGLGLIVAGQPTLDRRMAAEAPRLDARLAAREVQVDPAELLDLMVNNNIALEIIDVRDEADFNLFHIIDARRATWGELRDPAWVAALPARAVIVVVSNDETRATAAWRILAAQRVQNLYLLAGGVNLWLEAYGAQGEPSAAPEPIAGEVGDDRLRYRFSMALGGAHPAADPDPHHVPARAYAKKVTQVGRAAGKAGGCG